MDDLTRYRSEIDEIDAQMILLFERRMDIVRQVALYKKTRGMPVFQAGREQEVLDKAAARLANKDYADEAKRFMNVVMAISRAAQRRDIGALEFPRRSHSLGGPVAFYGAPGAFTEQALIDYFGDGRESLSCQEFEDVFSALKDGRADYGVLPIENSSTGAITQVYDLLGSYGFFIVGERRLRISQNLVGTAGASLETVRAVYSHEQGFEQASAFLAQHPAWEHVPYYSTSRSARHVARANDPALAAIASARAAALYGLEVIAPDIQNNQNNSTRFIVIAREMEPEGADKVSLAFTLDNESGTLYNTLRHFAERRINLVKIESRPIPEILWNYRFYLDFEGDIGHADVRDVLADISRGARDFLLLGAYRSDTPPL